MFWTLLLVCTLYSTLLYSYLHKKTRISLTYLYKDNIGVILCVYLPLLLAVGEDYSVHKIIVLSWLLLAVPGVAFTFTMIRFWRTPQRKIKAKEHQLVSPADGNVIYINKLDSNKTPIVIKDERIATIEEIMSTNLIQQPCWQIGINMTPFDVHKNCAPIEGKVEFSRHISGSFLSLKNPRAIAQNERHTTVLVNKGEYYGIVQTASRLVKRIDSYIIEGQQLEKGQWFGMIRFGSQVDLFIPIRYTVKVHLKEQIYAASTIIAEQE